MEQLARQPLGAVACLQQVKVDVLVPVASRKAQFLKAEAQEQAMTGMLNAQQPDDTRGYGHM